MATLAEALAPGGVIGILGGGQLGRMLALAAAPLGYRVHIFCPEADSPAAEVSSRATVAPYDDTEALERFAAAVDVVTFEFENIPLETATYLARHRPVRPSPDALGIAQDRLLEKRFVDDIGIPTAVFRAVDDAGDVETALAEVGAPAVLKTRRLGYDGKGQARLAGAADSDQAWESIGRAPAILEAFVAFEREISVVAARGLDGSVAAFDPVENCHVDHILDTTIAPAPIGDETARRAGEIAGRLLTALDYVGVIGVEMFLLPEAELLVNEIAPRVHNSGHWTIEGCRTSQFEQHIRAVCGLPLGPPERLFDAEMKNLLGDAIEAWPEILAEPGAHLHLYGKAEARPGRKMGHVTRLKPRG
ncbi:MAG: 5-(carboxyamino)imidazole ribonucleotide synthase [Alphaproteobacteria bacterium]|jgi:5-(carboxyamino)imidazole ribonucleotide synthase|nr:5-(carboxyamino)imidazole ribonucleotide synthase [Alphaproteobacteria bacterium]